MNQSTRKDCNPGLQ
uniref:Uncharacterized protein n=1 Tax=Anguilla anguilla TaxID=7936 RepID=A0A0E9RXR8_ANGAN